MKKRILIYITVFIMICPIVSSMANSLFPSSDELFGSYMPAFSSIDDRLPSTSSDEEGIIETYDSFTDADYYSFSKYLADTGCSLGDYKTEDSRIIIIVQRDGCRLRFEYDRGNLIARIIYLDDTRPEKEKSDVKEGKESILPQLEKLFGAEMPSLSKILSQDPIAGVSEDSSARIDCFDHVSLEDYYRVGIYFRYYGYTLISDTFKDRVITAVLEMKNNELTVAYNLDSKELTVTYPGLYYITEQTPDASTASLFPDLANVVGIMLPRIVTSTMTYPTNTEILSDGSLKEYYSNFTDKEYGLFSQYLKDQDCTVVDYAKENAILTVHLSKADYPFVFTYNVGTKEATITYPKGSNLEPDVTPEPVVTPEPTATPHTYSDDEIIELFGDQAWKAALQYFNNLRWNNPSSVTIYGHTISMYDDWNFLITIDYAGENKLGGTTRKYMYIVMNIFSYEIKMAF